MEVFNFKSFAAKTRNVGSQLRINSNTGEILFSAAACSHLKLSEGDYIEFIRQNGEWYVRKTMNIDGFKLQAKSKTSCALRFCSKNMIAEIRKSLIARLPYGSMQLIPHDELGMCIITSSYK